MLFDQFAIERASTPWAHFVHHCGRNDWQLHISRATLVRSPNPNSSVWPNLGKLIALFVFCALAACANVCAPVSVPANGPFPAIPANGVDGISWSVARVLWTSDASASVPATQQRIQYATAAEWANSPNTYSHVTAQTTQYAATATQNQSGIVSNLLPGTLYHFKAQSYQGGAWCAANDYTFTTLPKPAGQIIKPTLPVQVDTTRPAMNGTHWVYGTNCGSTAGTTYAIVTTNLQDCLNKMNAATGDDLGLPPAALGGPTVYPISQVFLHNSELAVSVSCTIAGSTCTQSGTAPANGSQIIFASSQYGVAPSPLNPGIPYKVINQSGSSFQLSYDGTTPITLLNTGSLVAYLPWPLTQPRMVIHSTAAANQLPPPGVRLGPDALAQYSPYMPNLQSLDPLSTALSFSPFTVNLTFENVAFSTDPSVAQNSNALDPAAFRFYMNTGLTNVGIIFDQCAFVPAPAPSRALGFIFNGINNAVVNSYVQFDFWQPHYYVPSSTLFSVSTPTTVTIPASTWSWVNANGTKSSCPNAGGTITISGTGSGSMYVWTNADCSSTAQLSNGLSASTTIPGLSITNAATPAYPSYNYTSVLGNGISTNAAFNLWGFAITNGAISTSATDISGNFYSPGRSTQAAEGSVGFYIAGYGPFKFDNNYIKGSGIGGVFWADDLTLGNTPCGTANPCPVQTVLGNLTVTRNTMTTDSNKFFYDSANWDGGNRYWRNINENKTGRYTLYDGNIIGPWGSQVGGGQCGLHETFTNLFVQIGSYPSYADSSDFTFTNNTCTGMPSPLFSTSYSWQFGYTAYPYPMKNVLLQNDLILNGNGYLGPRQNQPFRSDGHFMYGASGQIGGACGTGQLTNWGAPGENYQIDHITVFGQGGCFAPTSWYQDDLSSSGVTNSVLNLSSDATNAGLTASGVVFQPYGYLGGPCGAATLTGHNVYDCINNFQWGGNVILAMWTNSFPTSLVEYQTSDITNAQTYFTGYPASWPNASSIAGRTAQIGWFNTSTANFRLAARSPYISGSKTAIDGQDVGANMDVLEAHQGKVSNVRVLAPTSSSATVAFYAPDSFACGVDWASTAFFNGTGTWTRVTGTTGSPDPRIQSVSLTALPAHGLIYYRVNCAVMQPTGSIQLP